MRVGWPGGGREGWLWDGGFPRLLPKIDPRMEVDDELGMEGWPRGAPSRGVVALRRVCGLLMMDPCRQDKKKKR